MRREADRKVDIALKSEDHKAELLRVVNILLNNFQVCYMLANMSYKYWPEQAKVAGLELRSCFAPECFSDVILPSLGSTKSSPGTFRKLKLFLNDVEQLRPDCVMYVCALFFVLCHQRRHKARRMRITLMISGAFLLINGFGASWYQVFHTYRWYRTAEVGAHPDPEFRGLRDQLTLCPLDLEDDLLDQNIGDLKSGIRRLWDYLQGFRIEHADDLPPGAKPVKTMLWDLEGLDKKLEGLQGTVEEKKLHPKTYAKLKDFLPADAAAEVLAALVPGEAFRKMLMMDYYGVPVPRLVCIQGQRCQDGSMPVYRHPVDEQPPIFEFTPTVQRVISAARAAFKFPFNHALIQLYRGFGAYELFYEIAMMTVMNKQAALTTMATKGDLWDLGGAEAEHCRWVTCATMADAVMMDACLVNWWDNDAAVRTRLRESECMLVVVEGVGGAEVAPAPGMVIAKSVANARANAVVLRAIMGWIASQVPGMKLPSIDLLLCAVAALYDKNRLLKDGQRMYQDAWGLRRLAQLVKARLYKQCPPKDDVLLDLLATALSVTVQEVQNDWAELRRKALVEPEGEDGSMVETPPSVSPADFAEETAAFMELEQKMSLKSTVQEAAVAEHSAAVEDAGSGVDTVDAPENAEDVAPVASGADAATMESASELVPIHATAEPGSTTMPASSAHVVGQSDDDSDEVTVVGSKSFLEDLSAEELQERLAVTMVQLKNILAFNAARKRLLAAGYALDTDETQVPAVLPPDVDLATPSPRGGKPAEITPSPVSAAVAREGDFPDVDGDVFLTRREQLALRRRGHVTADAKPKKKASPKRKGKGKGKGKKWRKSTCSGSKTVPEQIEEPVPSEPLEQEVEEPVPSEPLEHEVEEPVPKPKKAAPKRKAIVVEPTEEPKESVDPKPKKKAASKRKAVVVEEPEAKPKKKAAPKRKAVVVEEPEELEAKPKKRAAPKRKAVVEEEPTEEPEKAVEEPKGKRVRAKNAVIEYSAPLSRRQLRNALLCQFQAPVRLVPYWTKCQLGIKVLHVKALRHWELVKDSNDGAVELAAAADHKKMVMEVHAKVYVA
ncbi:hypothetical protein AK812_SmicGene22736 [Symbiodinium microadriaticum]|uniref:Uncharacterized protein n=1 Tax=Symbiodinium microadriaticum TaxID=2951 RepID=A0A1Q9DJ24_SYMMI|nr:hypothetical protein AK812_SmicGene22736 [Symbiodinium microadriaticum]